MGIPTKVSKGISIHALREEGDLDNVDAHCDECISIHALREEGDFTDVVKQRVDFLISIHALREEGDASGMTTPTSRDLFLSTPSARRATCAEQFVCCRSYISIHALREEGDEPLLPYHCVCSISIHALREEGDLCHTSGKTQR